MKCLIDTNICIYLIKQRPVKVTQHFRQYTPGEIGISSITTSELYYGVHKSQQMKKNMAALNNFLLPFSILAYGEAASVIYGEIRANLQRTGQLIGPLDMMIAAHALHLDVPLVTNNTKEFNRVAGLQLENWVD